MVKLKSYLYMYLQGIQFTFSINLTILFPERHIPHIELYPSREVILSSRKTLDIWS